MRILQILASVDPKAGGPAKTAIELGEALAEKGHKATLYTTNFGIDGNLDVPINRSILHKGVLVHYFSVDWPRNYRVSWQLVWALAHEVAKFDIVQIHGLYLFTTLAGAVLARKHRIPYIITVHGMLDPFLRRKSRFKKAIYTCLFEKRYLDNAAAIHYTSQEEMKLANPVGIKSPTVVVPWGLNLHEYKTLPTADLFRMRYPDLKNKQIILYLGRINFKKGLDLLVRAFGELVRKRKDLHLIIAGPDNEGYGKRVRQWVSEARVTEHVTFTGMLQGEDKLAALSASDVFVLPSYTENFGVSVVEAMACGLPVVISNKVNIWREIANAEGGIVVNCDADELAKGILKIIDDPASQKRLVANGRKLVEEQFTWDKCAEKMIAAYESAIKRTV